MQQQNFDKSPSLHTAADSAERSLRVGAVIAGRFEVLSHIGSGGMGRVYKAVDRELDRIVALKLVHPWLTLTSQTTMKRLQREAKVLSSLNHPSIVRTFSVGLTGDDGVPFLVMDFIEGITLKDRLAAGPQLTKEEFACIFRDLLDALQHAHEHGIVHRDVKPGNIMLATINDEQKAYIMDFGIARALCPTESEVPSMSLTQTGDVLGSPHYMSPEQCQGLAPDQRCDLYALCCVMYECLAGRPPFDGDTPLDIMYKQINAPPSALPDLRQGGFPPSLGDLVAQGLSKSPRERFESAADLRRNLDLALAGRRVKILGKRSTLAPASAMKLGELAVIAVAGAGIAYFCNLDRELQLIDQALLQQESMVAARRRYNEVQKSPLTNDPNEWKKLYEEAVRDKESTLAYKSAAWLAHYHNNTDRETASEWRDRADQLTVNPDWKDPGMAQAVMWLAGASLVIGDAEDAERRYSKLEQILKERKSIDWVPGWLADLNMHRARSLRALERWDEAHKAVESAESYYLELPQTNESRSDKLIQLWTDVLIEHVIAKRNDPPARKVCQNLEELLASYREPSKPEQKLTIAKAYHAVGVFRRLQGKREQALAALDQAVKDSPGNLNKSRIYRTRAEVHMDLSKDNPSHIEWARADLRKALDFAGKDRAGWKNEVPAAHLLLGQTYMREERYHDAIEHLKSALEAYRKSFRELHNPELLEMASICLSGLITATGETGDEENRKRYEIELREAKSELAGLHAQKQSQQRGDGLTKTAAGSNHRTSAIHDDRARSQRKAVRTQNETATSDPSPPGYRNAVSPDDPSGPNHRSDAKHNAR